MDIEMLERISNVEAQTKGRRVLDHGLSQLLAANYRAAV